MRDPLLRDRHSFGSFDDIPNDGFPGVVLQLTFGGTKGKNPPRRSAEKRAWTKEI